MPEWFLLLLMSLACFRLTRLITDDKIFSEVRNFLIRKTPRNEKVKVKQGLTCPWCMSFWISLGITGLVWWLGHIPWQWCFIWAMAVWANSILLNALFTHLVTYSKDV